MNCIKQHIIVILLFILFCSCDRELNEDFVVKNSSNNTILVSYENVLIDDFEMEIPPNSEKTIMNETGHGNSVYFQSIENWFYTLEITVLTNDTPKINCLEDKLWTYKEVSDTYAVHTLEIDELSIEE